MLEITNIIPIIGIKKLLDENTLTAPIKPPKESEPVSPINTLAFETLKIKNANIPPTIHTDNKFNFSYSSVFK